MTEVICKRKLESSRFKSINQFEDDRNTIRPVVEFEIEQVQRNMSVKRSMAEELRKMGLSEMAISKNLNIKQ